MEDAEELRHGEVPFTDGYKKQGEDVGKRPTSTPGGHPIPSTLVEKVDPSSSSYGEVPGTEAYDRRRANAVPDLIVRTPEDHGRSSTVSRSRSGSTPRDLPIPITKVEKVECEPRHEEIPGTKAVEMRKKDAKSDVVEEINDGPGKSIHPLCTSTSD